MVGVTATQAMATSGSAPGSQLMFPMPVEAPPRLEDDVTAEDWRIWQQQFEAYRELTELDKRPDKYKVCVVDMHLEVGCPPIQRSILPVMSIGRI